MKAVATLTALAAGVALVTACDRPVEKRDLLLNVTTNQERGLMTVTAETNLPDGTELGVMMQGEKTEYFAQDEGFVYKGKAVFGPFSRKGGGLSPDKYQISVSAPASRLQPKAIQKIIGEDYRNFRSNNIRSGPLGEHVSVETTVAVASIK